jgi:branched-chain amino acid transport system permease protein
MLLAPAYALVYGLVGRINLAFGELAALGGYGAGLGLLLADVWLGDSPVLLLVGALALSLAVAATHGEAIGRLVAVPLARRSGQAFLVATLGLSVLLLEYMHLAFGASSRWSPPVLNVPVAVARAGDFVVSVTEMALLSALAGAGALGLLALRMRRGHAGRAWRAVADDPGMAALCGVDPRDTLLGAVVTASLLAGLAGCIMTLHYGGIGFAGGLSIGLKALTAAVLGGIGSLAGAVLGALALGLAEALWSALMPIEFRDMAIYAGLVLLLALRPGGLLGFATGTPRRV